MNYVTRICEWVYLQMQIKFCSQKLSRLNYLYYSQTLAIRTSNSY